MSAAAPSTVPADPPADPGQPSRAANLLTLVRKLIDYARELAATFQQSAPIAGLADYARNFGTADIAAILARITSGLLRAQALEARLIRGAAHLDAKPRTAIPASPRAPRTAPATAPPSEHPNLAHLPTPEWIAAQVRSRPIGAVIADICRDLGILPSHPLWRELQLAIIRHGGNLATFYKEMNQRLFPVNLTATSREAWPLMRAPPPGWRSTRPP